MSGGSEWMMHSYRCGTNWWFCCFTIISVYLLSTESLFVGAVENHITTIANSLQPVNENCYRGSYAVALPPYGKCSGFRTCVVGHYCAEGIMKLCPAGTYGAVAGLDTATCSGICPAGNYCPEGTVHPIPCGDASVYCPLGSSQPLAVPTGYYSLGLDQVHFQNQYAVAVCSKGHYCDGGRQTPCPGGVFGDMEGLTTPACSGPCPAGFYCPYKSVYRDARPCNFNNPSYYCPEGSDHPLFVKLGYYSVDNQALAMATSGLGLGVGVGSALLSDGGFSEGGGGGVVLGVASSVTSSSSTVDVSVGAGVGGYTGEALCPPGSYCIEGIRYLCPEGRYGSISGQTNSSCTGACAVGHYCPAGSISKIQIPCGSNHQYCPEGSARPTAVTTGYYTLYLSEFYNPENNSLFVHTDPASIRTMEAESVGAYEKLYFYNSLRSGNQSLCEPGYYCLSDGIRRKCPVGRYGATAGLTDASCTGPCPAGYYCPEGSSNGTALECGSAAVYCPVGAKQPYHVSPGYFTAGGLTVNTSTTERKCTPGTYCSGDGIQRLCAAGRYGDSFGLVTEQCSGSCLPGYYCPEGSVVPTEVMCGDPSYYCPPVTDYPMGNYKPTKVSLGYYSVGSGGSAPGGDGASAVVTRTGQVLAEKGYYAVQGVKTICPAGRYGATMGLSSPLCSGLCDIDGYYCPPGSVSPKQKACGGSNVICPKSTVVPLLVRPGFYTSDPRLEICSPGQYRNWTTSHDASDGLSAVMPTAASIPECQLCPEGTYKPTSGDEFTACVLCNPNPNIRNDSISSANRVTCECQLVLEPAYTSVYNHSTSSCTVIDIAELPYQDQSFYELNSSFTRYEEYECEAGYYCVDGKRYICPAGVYGSKRRSSSVSIAAGASCEGKCATGYYCPEGSSSPYALPCGAATKICPEGSAVPVHVSEGYYTPEDVSELYRSVQLPCPPGSYCINAKRHLCPPGTYSDQNFTSSRTCLGECDAGYYCTAGSTDKRQHKCGSAAVICPRGSHAPLPVLNGFYSMTTGDDAHAVSLWDPTNSTQSAQIPCEPGYYCTQGVKYPCPPGTYGGRYGLNTSACSGFCAPGYYCPSYLYPPPPDAPVGTIFPRKPHQSAAEYPCGGSGVFCPKGSFYPQRVGGGNYTVGGGVNNQTRTGQEICTPGNYCIGGVIQPCPKGKYGATPGLSESSCTSWCPPAHACPLGTAVPIECKGQTYNVGAGFDCAPCPGDNSFELPCHDSRYCCFQGG